MPLSSDEYRRSQLREAAFKRHLDAIAEKSDRLSNRELEVLELMAEGHTRRETGRILFIEENTVKRHLEHIKGKLRARNTTHAVSIAFRRNLFA